MKIKNKIIVLFAVILLVVITLGLISIEYVSDHYIHYKYDNAYEQYYSQELSISEFSEYLINEGFIVTNEEIASYQGSGNLTCHVEEDQIVVYENNKPVLYAILNENIVTDLKQLLLYAAIFINILVIVMLVIIYVYFNKDILYKLNKLELEMVNFKNIESFATVNNDSNNEIDLLTQEFYKMANMIKAEDKQKKFLIMTLSHELKNPISNIEAIIDMNKLGVEPYNDNFQENELITTQVEKMKAIVIDLLNTYKYEITDDPIIVEVVPMIQEIIENHQLPTTNLIFDYHIKQRVSIEINQKVFEHIISNIITNIYKYSLERSTVVITFADNKIKFENIRNQTVNDKSTEIGLLLNQYLSQEIGLNINIVEDEQQYTTIIEL